MDTPQGHLACSDEHLGDIVTIEQAWKEIAQEITS